ncbi:hypothetical protein ACOZ4N_20215 (plasmid) [Halorientalis pallida]|uniref:hypothetical protein n=1 Tax=Halorientalis pallida TaxID=2479928 RepID=UPI003C6EE935
MGLVDSLVVFVVSLLIGALGIHVGARIVTGENDFEHAVWTALFGALIWGIVGYIFGGIPGLGPVLVFLAYLWVIKRRYSGGWLSAAAIALVAWIAAILVLSVLAEVGITEFDAFGVPGV